MLFAMVQITGSIMLSDRPGGSGLPFIALAVIVLVALPFSRSLDRRWARLAHDALPSAGLMRRFRADRGRLWQLALFVPTLWIGAYAFLAGAASI